MHSPFDLLISPPTTGCLPITRRPDGLRGYCNADERRQAGQYKPERQQKHPERSYSEHHLTPPFLVAPILYSAEERIQAICRVLITRSPAPRRRSVSCRLSRNVRLRQSRLLGVGLRTGSGKLNERVHTGSLHCDIASTIAAAEITELKSLTPCDIKPKRRQNESRNSSRIQKSHDRVRLWPRCRNALDSWYDPRRYMFELPSVLYRQTEIGRCGGPGREVQKKVRP